MPQITSYATLQTEIASLMNRDDLTAQLPLFIQLAEAEINRTLRVPQMIDRVTATAAEGTVSLPSDWLETISLAAPGGGWLEYVTNDEMLAMRSSTTIDQTGSPSYFTMHGTKLQVFPFPSSGTVSLELVYRKALPALSGTTTTNWLLAKSPDLYLYGAVLKAAIYADEDERVPLWRSEYDRIFQMMEMEGVRSDKPQGSLRMRPRTFG